MKKHSIADYCLYCLVKTISLIVRFIPLTLSVYVMRRLGALAFYFLAKKRMIAYRNIKIAFPNYTPRKINSILKQTFMNCAQHLVEIAYMPWIDDKYVNKFIEFEGLDDALKLMKNKKGGIFLCLHEGSWEIGSAVTARALKDYNYTVLVREQPGAPLVSDLLNSYRVKNVHNVMPITDSLRPIVESLKKGYAIGMAADHGAQGGILVNFFGRLALTPIGALKFALKLDTNIFIGFMKGKRKARHKITLKPYSLVRTGDEENDLRLNLENINRVYERYITDSPQEYLWFFKRWKHSPQRNALVLSDGKAGHLKQSLAVLDLINKLPLQVKYDVVEVKFSNLLQKAMFYLC
ncbi:MAG: hypothetical protein PHY46_04030, partial [Candidatus Omnitrophica bacterium]|nr:hypothetical protein [Candidatus Omnitrophota bacterium]